MTSETIFCHIRNNRGIPVGFVSVSLVEELFIRHTNGDTLYEWRLQAFPVSHRFLESFWDVKQALNRYEPRGEPPHEDGDVISNPVDLEQARGIMAKFVGYIEQQVSHLEHLFIQWPRGIVDSYEAFDLIYEIPVVLENPPGVLFLPGTYMVENYLLACVVWDSVFKHVILEETFTPEGLFRINDLFGETSISLNDTAEIFAQHQITKDEYVKLTGEQPPVSSKESAIIRFYDEEGVSEDSIYLFRTRGIIDGVRIDLTAESAENLREMFERIK